MWSSKVVEAMPAKGATGPPMLWTAMAAVPAEASTPPIRLRRSYLILIPSADLAATARPCSSNSKSLSSASTSVLEPPLALAFPACCVGSINLLPKSRVNHAAISFSNKIVFCNALSNAVTAFSPSETLSVPPSPAAACELP